VLTVAEADYGWLFEQAACVVHHGGVGTVASVLSAGVPQVLLPQVASQERWGEILTRERLCTGVLRTESLDAEQLAGAIRQALETGEVQCCARNWASRVKASNGIVDAVDAIAQHIARLQERGILPR
jgi:UDP:flavonoid glycosyltransferase YjiC (YdhE family)